MEMNKWVNSFWKWTMDREWADDETEQRKEDVLRKRKKGEDIKRVESRKGAQNRAWDRKKAIDETD